MLAEVQHRAANDFALAAATLLAARRTAPVGERGGYDQAVARLQEQAALSRLLAPPVLARTVDLRASLEAACLGLSRVRLEGLGIAISVDVEPVAMASRSSWMVVAIVAELVLNAAKHAFSGRDDGAVAGTIRVTASARAGLLSVVVSDDGAGCARPPARAGSGSSIVDALAAELQADIRRLSTPLGTETVLSVPLTDRDAEVVSGAPTPSAGQRPSTSRAMSTPRARATRARVEIERFC